MNSIAIGLFALTLGFTQPGRAQPITPPWESLPPGALIVDSDEKGVHNVRVFFADQSRTVLSGSLPHGERAYETLAEMGVTTVISVDAARPELEFARKNGLRYIHIPIKYSGITEDQRAALALALAQSEGTVYVHCHHGRHRGPAAAAIGLIGIGACTPEQANLLMKEAGTSAKYTGLWGDVARADILDGKALASAAPLLVEHARIDGLPAIMAEMDRAFDHLDVLSDNAWQAPAYHPDLSAVSEAGHLADLFRTILADESLPVPGEEYATLMERSALLSALLESQLVEAQNNKATETFEMLGDSCNQCHATYR